MTDILNAPDLPSEDEEDDDYDPSRDAEKGDETKRKPKGEPKGRHKRLLEGVGEHCDSEDEDTGQGSAYSKTAVKKAKTDALWAGLGGGVKPRRAEPSGHNAAADAEGKGSIPSTGINWGSLCWPIAKAAPSMDKNRNWMLQLGFSVKKADGADSAAGMTRRQSTTRPGNNDTRSAPCATAAEPAVEPATTKTQEEQSQSIAATALAAARAAASGTGHGQVSVLETRRFAGKDVQVSKSVTAAEAAAQVEAEAKRRNKAGLDSVLASLQAAKKVNVLDKSRSDWKDFKTSDTKVEDELEAYKKSNNKYLDKVDFLKRAELRQYEKERDARLGGDVRSRARL